MEINQKPKGIIAKIRKWFIAGTLVSLPIILTFYIVVWIIEFFDDLIIYPFFADTILIKIPGIGIIVAVLSMGLVGFFTANFLGKFFVKISEYILNKIPLVRTIYSTLKQIFDTMLSTKSKAFKEVVLLEYPKKDIWVLAFVTADVKGEIEEKLGHEIISLFLPTTPNPTSGFLLFVPKKNVIELNMKTDYAMKLIISGGMVNATTEALTKVKKNKIKPIILN